MAAKAEYTAKSNTIELAVPEGLVPTKVAYMRRSCVHGFIKNEAGLPLGPVRSPGEWCIADAFLVSIDVGGVKIGPADFLFAALEILETGAEEVAVEPRDQLGDIARYLPKMACANFRGTWIYTEDYKDEWTSNRLRWQFWTFRYE